MIKNQLIDTLTALGIKPSRKLGQNFLIDPNMLEALVREAGPANGQNVLEVGPGTGVLTRKLLESGCNVTAVEIDARLCEYLNHTLGQHPAFTLVQGDACRIDYDSLFGETPFSCIANLPYSASSVFIARIVAAVNQPQAMFLLLQKEMAERLHAKPDTKAYGALSVVVQLSYSVRLLRNVPPQVFYPAPEVGSAHVHLKRKSPQPTRETRKAVAKLAKTAFAQRRKMALKLLNREFPHSHMQSAFEQLHIPKTARAEHITIENFADLATCLTSQSRPYWNSEASAGDDDS